MEWAGIRSDTGSLGLIGWCLSGVRRKGERSAGCLDEEGGIDSAEATAGCLGNRVLSAPPTAP